MEGWPKVVVLGFVFDIVDFGSWFMGFFLGDHFFSNVIGYILWVIVAASPIFIVEDLP